MIKPQLKIEIEDGREAPLMPSLIIFAESNFTLVLELIKYVSLTNN